MGDYEEKKAAAHAEDVAWHTKAAADAAVVAAGRGAKAAEAVEKANAAEADYQKKMGVFEEKLKDAKAADKAYGDAVEASKEEQAEMDKQAAAADKADNAIVNCGSSDKCLAADGTCKDVTDDGPYLSKNMVDCTDDESEEWDHTDDNNGLDWAGVGPAPTMAPIPAPNATCISSYGALAAPVKAAMDAHKEDESKCPLIELACPPPAGQLDIEATSKEALIGYLGAFFATAAVCPPVCYPGSETHLDNGEQDTHGICTTSAMMLMLEQQVKGFPIYQNTGTNGRFLANNEAMDLCTAMKELAKGIGAGIKLE